MNRIFAILLFLFLTIQNVRAEAFLPFDGPRPLAVMVETDPWLMVIGSDTPSFVLYEDGQVIYRKRSEKGTPKYLWKLLTLVELRSLQAKLISFGPYRFKGQNRMNVAEVSDQSEAKLFLKFEGAELVTSIYGIKFSDVSRDEGGSKTPLPSELRKLYGFLSSLEFRGASEWAPKYAEVMAWDYTYAPDPSISWPKHWPGLDSPTTFKKKTMYSIFVPGVELKAIAAFLGTRSEKGAVEIDGKKFAVSVRPTFPSEPIWRTAFSNLE
ncbi:MAG TPA: hypothetical protein VF861_00295 [Telluria sp.]